MSNSQPLSHVKSSQLHTKHSYRVDAAWPQNFKGHTKQMHLHFCELLDTWLIHPDRISSTNRPIVIDSEAEYDGQTVFHFPNWWEMNEFVSFFNLRPFMYEWAKVQPIGNSADQPFALELRNCFDSADAHEFLSRYHNAVDRLISIHQERVRAIQLDAGHVGYLSADHFNTRERVQLHHIDHARETLARSLNKSPEPNPVLDYIPTQPMIED